MDIRILTYFLAVAREKNISRAAKSLHITQPTLKTTERFRRRTWCDTFHSRLPRDTVDGFWSISLFKRKRNLVVGRKNGEQFNK